MTNEVLFEQKGHLGLITLNRPAALNALTLSMIQALQKQLEIWKSDEHIHAIVLQAVHGKAFCAGGDIRWLYDSGRINPQEACEFFRHEYQLNHCIHHLGKPYIALMDGITMGGGVGIALHGSHPVASPRFVFAMPETGIGFFPDIGASFLLSRLPNHLGIYLGLTGDRLGAADALKTGLIKNILPAEQMPAFLEALLVMDLSQLPYERVDACLEQFAVSTMDDSGSALHPLITATFSHTTVEGILHALTHSESDWANKIIQTLLQKSPLSLKITLTQLLKAKGLSLAECLKMDFNLVNHFMQGHDFYEGVRALIIEKDKMPKWKPPNLSLVTGDQVVGYFERILPELEFM